MSSNKLVIPVLNWYGFCCITLKVLFMCIHKLVNPVLKMIWFMLYHPESVMYPHAYMSSYVYLQLLVGTVLSWYGFCSILGIVSIQKLYVTFGSRINMKHIEDDCYYFEEHISLVSRNPKSSLLVVDLSG